MPVYVWSVHATKGSLTQTTAVGNGDDDDRDVKTSLDLSIQGLFMQKINRTKTSNCMGHCKETFQKMEEAMVICDCMLQE
ncbi:hypothetical protein Y032_0019g3918 [Ancylostoma ceylanicum]|uniref:Uncharacterized protein n=1 Tax=Ancylostoma ceylanicum TaxID=53326 RepID=A0A016V2X9_9BILA|nr:hypothetical protein Y032_0019g3918 [Ancylostoma ceylanicum]